MGKAKGKRPNLRDNKTLRAARSIWYQRRCGTCYGDKVALAIQTRILTRFDFVMARKAYLENQNADVGVLAALRCDMQHRQRVASQSHEKMVKLKQIESALLDRAAKIVKKRQLLSP